jgi:ABC-2 type transport system permease protein
MPGNGFRVAHRAGRVAAEPRLPSLPLAYLDLAGYVVAACGLGAWRARRDV